MTRSKVVSKLAVVAVTMAAGIVLVGQLPAAAGSKTATLSITASVSANCTITIGAGGIAFGTYDPIVENAVAALNGTGTVTIACTKGTTTTIGLDSGVNGPRRMISAGSYLSYELYSDTNRTVVWTTASPVTPPAAPSKDARDFTVYGKVAGGQDVPAGSYADTVVATVNY